MEKVTYKDLLSYSAHIFRPQKRAIPFLMAGMGSAAFIDTLFPVVTGYLIETISHADARGWSRELIWIFFGFLGLELAYHTTRNATIFLWNRVAIRNLYKIVTEGFAKVQKFSTDWHANAFAGGTVRKITRGMWAFDRYEDIIFMFILPTSVVMVSTVALMFLRWPLMGWVTLLSVMAYVGYSVWAVISVNAPLFRKAAEYDTKVGACLADAITGNAAVKAFGRETDEEQSFGHVTDRWYETSIKSWQMSNWMDLIRRYLSLLMMGVMVGTAIYLWSQGQASSADVVYTLTAYIVMSGYLRNIGEQISNLQKAAAEMEDIIGFWKRRDEVLDQPNARTLNATAGSITFDRVSFQYAGKADPVYHDFSLDIKPGEKVALVGHSGSGKSTFVKLIQRLYDVQEGSILIDGQDIRAVTQRSLRKAIALVPQDPVLFHRSIAANIAYGKPDATLEEIITAAKRAYAHDFIQHLPHGYDTLVGERGVKLSGGERQRVAIARAILADAPILILDEATSSLDSMSEHYIQKALASLMENRTSITIAHRLATIKSVDRILVFDRGRIVEQGTHESLILQTGSHYKRLYDIQALDLVGGQGQILAAE